VGVAKQNIKDLQESRNTNEGKNQHKSL